MKKSEKIKEIQDKDKRFSECNCYEHTCYYCISKRIDAIMEVLDIDTA
jgi:hypothetical protein